MIDKKWSKWQIGTSPSLILRDAIPHGTYEPQPVYVLRQRLDRKTNQTLYKKRILFYRDPHIHISRNFSTQLTDIVTTDRHFLLPYSHSTVAGGLDVMSYTTLFTPGTWLQILAATSPKNSGLNGYLPTTHPPSRQQPPPNPHYQNQIHILAMNPEIPTPGHLAS